MGLIESKKVESFLYVLLIGSFCMFNEEIFEDFLVINVDKYYDGWLFEMVGDSFVLMELGEYFEYLMKVWEVI